MDDSELDDQPAIEYFLDEVAELRYVVIGDAPHGHVYAPGQETVFWSLLSALCDRSEFVQTTLGGVTGEDGVRIAGVIRNSGTYQVPWSRKLRAYFFGSVGPAHPLNTPVLLIPTERRELLRRLDHNVSWAFTVGPVFFELYFLNAPGHGDPTVLERAAAPTRALGTLSLGRNLHDPPSEYLALLHECVAVFYGLEDRWPFTIHSTQLSIQELQRIVEEGARRSGLRAVQASKPRLLYR